MQLQLYGKKIWVFRKPIDFRKSITGLTSFVSENLRQNPEESIFLFYNKNKDKIKCLSWHKNGFVLIYKRLEKTKFCFDFNKEEGIFEVNMDEFSWLLAGLERQKMRHWHELSYQKFS